jgi:hypothetical protein
MAAPITAYLTIDAKFRGANDVLMSVNPARSIYGSAADLEAAKTLIKTLFYLDDIIGFKAKYAGIDYHGFWGVCITGSTNWQMHNSARWINVSVARSVSTVYTFNDAGLNTLGFAGLPTCTNKQSGAHSFQAFFRSAYYVQTSDHHIEVKRLVGGVANFSQVVPFGGMAQAAEGTKTGTPEAVTFDFSAGDYIEMRSKIVNAEGTYISAMVSFIVEPRVYTAKFNSTHASWACNNTDGTTEVTIYVSNWKLNNGVVLYSDVEMTTNVTPGYYSISGRWYKVEADLMIGANITDQDACGTWRSTDPAYVPPYQVKNWTHYETMLSGSDAGCFVYYASGTYSPRTTYRNINNNKHYGTSAAAIAEGTSGYATDGYYFEASGGVMNWYEIQSGVITDSGIC